MERSDDKLKKAIGRVESIAQKIEKSPPPNEIIIEFDYESLIEVSRNIVKKLSSEDKDKVIKSINDIIHSIPLPDIDHSTASRGLLIAQSRGLELIRALNDTKNVARSIGCADPDLPDIDVNSSVSNKHILEINKKLEDLAGYVADLGQEMKLDKQSGISISLGPVSTDLNVLRKLVESTTEDIRDYISTSYLISSRVLQDKFEFVNSSAKSLLTVVKQDSANLGRKILSITKKIAKAAADAYISGLNLIKDVFNSKNRKLELDTDLDYGPVPDEMIDADLASSDNNYAYAANRILANLVRSIKTRPSGHTLNDDKITSCRFFRSHDRPYLRVYASNPKHSFSCQISVREFEVLKNFHEKLLAKMMEKVNEMI